MKPIHYIVFITLIISVFSCGKLIDEFYLSDKMKAQIPFRGQEMITFIDSNGYNHTLQSEDRFNEIFEYPECNS